MNRFVFLLVIAMIACVPQVNLAQDTPHLVLGASKTTILVESFLLIILWVCITKPLIYYK